MLVGTGWEHGRPPSGCGCGNDRSTSNNRQLPPPQLCETQADKASMRRATRPTHLPPVPRPGPALRLSHLSSSNMSAAGFKLLVRPFIPPLRWCVGSWPESPSFCPESKQRDIILRPTFRRVASRELGSAAQTAARRARQITQGRHAGKREQCGDSSSHSLHALTEVRERHGIYGTSIWGFILERFRGHFPASRGGAMPSCKWIGILSKCPFNMALSLVSKPT